MEPWWNDIDRETEEFRGELVPVPLLPSQIPKGTDLGANPGLCSERLASDYLSHGMAIILTEWNDFIRGSIADIHAASVIFHLPYS
jgi:hypothetical protein